MESTAQQDAPVVDRVVDDSAGPATAHKDLIGEIDQLGERIELAKELIVRLRAERTELQNRCDALEREHGRLLALAGAKETADLVDAMGRLRQLEKDNRRLLGERHEVTERLGKLIEKVDLLERDA